VKATALFIDEAQIDIAAGNGGNGSASFRREKFEPSGGPDGGDGGKGGDVVLVATRNVSTLLELRSRITIKAKNGADGMSRDMYGKGAKDIEIHLPVGTAVYDANENPDEPIADLVEDGQRFIAARGGRGGRGNIHFKTSTNQAPTTAESGRLGKARSLRLSLKLLADVGLVGLPNAGKSTLLTQISAARPKVAAYPFTTLIPCLGVASIGERSFVVADIPGLIAGASDGAGLGDQFLRHVERTRVLVHVLDVGQLALEGRDPLCDYETIRKELGTYDLEIMERLEIIALSKVDLLADADEVLAPIEKFFHNKGRKVFRISSATKQGITELIRGMAETIDAAAAIEEENENKKEEAP